MQQWELLASPGHVLLARVDQYRRKLRLPKMVLAGAVVVALAGVPAAYYTAKAGGGVVQWIVGKVGGFVAQPPKKDPTPRLKNIRPIVAPGFSATLDSVPDLEADVLPAMKAQVAAAAKGMRLEDCDFGRKIDSEWATPTEITPRCRYSKDGSRLWVWSLVKKGGEMRPWLGLIAAHGDQPVNLYQISISGAAQSAQAPSLLPTQIPRAIATDFPELSVKTGAKND